MVTYFCHIISCSCLVFYSVRFKSISLKSSNESNFPFPLVTGLPFTTFSFTEAVIEDVDVTVLISMLFVWLLVPFLVILFFLPCEPNIFSIKNWTRTWMMKKLMAAIPKYSNVLLPPISLNRMPPKKLPKDTPMPSKTAPTRP